MVERYLYDLADIFRSKNAGPFKTTIDIFFKNRAIYDKVKASSVINRETVAAVYRMPAEQIEGIFYQDDAKGIKITMTKSIAADDTFATDVYGAQQHAPLMKLKVDL